ncbi:hypothetical protein [Jatrophihabitans sp.]|uniref:hypothetical protein n=1 Tax=Jatrophihabitans sp. TaxID=1932789 RepID=UPI002C276809|nr:hypothetical protein [Jatrophihabitans sp.]
MRLRSGAFPASLFGFLALLSAWWLPAGTAHAASYPPALGCAVTGTAGEGGVQVQGIGFRAGSPVRISAGRQGIRTIADPAGSFEAWLPARLPAAGTALTATGPGCTAHGVVNKNPSSQPGESPPPSQPGSRPGPVPSSEPTAVAIPVVPLTHVPSQLFLGLAGAVLLTGAALTGLTGRWGHRAESRPSAGTSVSGTVPVAPDNA